MITARGKIRDAAPTSRVMVMAILVSTVAFLDSTVVNLALPAIKRDLGGGLATSSGLLTATCWPWRPRFCPAVPSRTRRWARPNTRDYCACSPNVAIDSLRRHHPTERGQ
jgi:hypothetical protein